MSTESSCSNYSSSLYPSDSEYSTSSLDSDMSAPINSGVTGIAKPTSDNVLPQLERDLAGNLFEGVTIEDFVHQVWGISPADISTILKHGDEWISPNLTLALDRYKKSAGVYEPQMYDPFRELAENIANVVRASFDKAGSMVEYWVGGDDVIKTTATRKPDMLLIHKPVSSNPTWSITLAIIVFKRHKRTKDKQPDLIQKDATLLEGTGAQLPLISKELQSARLANVTAKMATLAVAPNTSCNARDMGNQDLSSVAKSTRGPTKDQLQLATYALESLNASTRHYTVGILIDKLNVTLWYYDRACIIKTTTFDFEQEPEKLALLVFAASTCDNTSAGFDPLLLNSTGMPHEPLPTVVGAQIKLKGVDFSIINILHTYRGLIGRGTMVYEVVQIYKDGAGAKHNQTQALKLSWPLTKRPLEALTIKTLRATIPEWADHLPEVTLYEKFTSESLGLPRVTLLKNLEYSDRQLHIQLMPKYSMLWEVGSIERFIDVFVDYIECHYHAYTRGRILHRDLSENNLMFKESDNGVRGILGDWDMASELDDAGQIPASGASHRTGTIKFMAVDLLTDEPPHLYRHDLESFFYILIWASVHYDLKNKTQVMKINKTLADWDNAQLPIAQSMKFILSSDYETAATVFKQIRPEFQGVREKWIEPLWSLFYEARCSRPIPFTPKAQSYDYDTYGGRLTFHTFMAALGRTPR